MNKEAKQIYERLEKDLKKNKPKLLKLCKKYIETEDDSLLIDIDYYAELVYRDSQDKLLILICNETDEEL